ncbi:tannase and feruloyl esterase [Stemphylium lycopersici]|nr:tannase and feruloyl esterase [Stemphylium lycopersici]
MRLEQPLRAALLGASSALAAPHTAEYPTNGTDFSAKCADLASSLVVDGGVVHASEFVAAGTNFTAPVYDETCADGSQTQSITVDMCRVALYVSTSERSGFNMEAWLPSNWTGRFLSGGNGGLNGCIKFEDLAYASGLGFAAVGTNNGHNGTSGLPFLNNSDVVEDFAYRALRNGAIVGKQITKEFYGKPQDRSYYLGCSTGGRQGFKLAQDYPGEWDGIVAGAPAMAFNNLTSWSGHFYTLTGPANSSSFVTPAKWAVVHEDVLAKCDKLDNLEDGILEDPLLCNYDPSGLACSGSSSNTTTCLTPEELATVKGVYSPLRNDAGDLVYPRLQPGAELPASRVIINGRPFPYTTDWFRYAIYNDPTWDPATLSSADYDTASKLDLFGIQTFNGDLSGVQNNGTKVLHWHGGADFVISSDNSARYYEHVRSTMGLSPADLDEFYRYFLVSGTGHCGGGDGAHAVGQGLGEINGYKPSHNVLTALVDWVENGNAPETIVGTKFVNDTEALGVQFERAHCRFPRTNVYKGGDEALPESWECVERGQEADVASADSEFDVQQFRLANPYSVTSALLKCKDAVEDGSLNRVEQDSGEYCMGIALQHGFELDPEHHEEDSVHGDLGRMNSKGVQKQTEEETRIAKRYRTDDADLPLQKRRRGERIVAFNSKVYVRPEADIDVLRKQAKQAKQASGRSVEDPEPAPNEPGSDILQLTAHNGAPRPACLHYIIPLRALQSRWRRTALTTAMKQNILTN